MTMRGIINSTEDARAELYVLHLLLFTIQVAHLAITSSGSFQWKVIL